LSGKQATHPQRRVPLRRICGSRIVRRHQKRDTKNGAWRQAVRIALSSPNCIRRPSYIWEMPRCGAVLSGVHALAH